MEIIILLVILGVGLVWYYNNRAAEKRLQDAKTEDTVPYKVEAPAVKETTMPTTEETPNVVVSEKPAKAQKAKATKPKAPKAPKTTNAKTPRKKKTAE